MEFNLLIKKTYKETLQQTCGSKNDNWHLKHQNNGCFGVRTLWSWDYRYSINYIRFFLFFFLTNKRSALFFGTKTKRKQNGDCVNDGRNSVQWSQAWIKTNCHSCVKNFLSNGWTIIFSEEVRQFSEVYFFHCQDWKNCFRFRSTCFSCPASLCTFLPRPLRRLNWWPITKCTRSRTN